jgi:hypothetical protein
MKLTRSRTKSAPKALVEFAQAHGMVQQGERIVADAGHFGVVTDGCTQTGTKRGIHDQAP